MRTVLTQLGGILLCGLLSASPALPQTANDKGKTLDAIVAMDDANARITALQQFIKTNPTQVTAREALVASYAQLGESHLAESNIEKALDAFQRAVKALPKTVSNEFFNQTVSMMPMAISVRGYRAEAVGIAQMLETRFANEATRLGAIGEYYLTIDASSEAIHVLEIAAQLAPEDPRLHRALGMAYRMGLRIDEAVAAYQLAVRYSPQDRRAFYDLADLYRSQGAYEDAMKLYRRQLEVEPKHTPSLKGLALALTALGKDDEATAELNKARDLEGSLKAITEDQLLQTQLAFYYLSRNRLKEAEQAANASLAFEPRYSWARIIAAEILIAQGKFFEAERHLLEAQKLANFPTLAFTLGKLYLMVEDFDGAIEQFKKAFRYTPTGKFTTRLGGVRNLEADELRDLLAPEHQAAIFLAESPTSDETFRIAESLVRVNARLAENEEAAPKTTKLSGPSLETAAQAFVQAEGSRRSFRALFMATRLAQAGKALPVAIKLAEQALELAEVATEENGSLRDYPNFDRTGRLQIFRGRAYDARGWALFKSNKLKESINVLSQAVSEYGNLPEGKRTLWHLATAYEAAGAQSVALEMYLAAYEPPAVKNAADIQRSVIENLYRKVNNSLTGLDEALGKPLKASTVENIVASAKAAQPVETAKAPETAPAPTVAVITPNETREKEPSAPAAPMIVTRKIEKVAATPSQTVASATAPPPAKEPVRVGLLGIPVNNSGKGRTAVKPPVPAPAPTKLPETKQPEIKQPEPETKAAPEKTVVATTATEAPIAPPGKETAAPAKEVAKQNETPAAEPITKPTVEVATQTEPRKAETKETVEPPPAPINEPVKAAPVEPTRETVVAKNEPPPPVVKAEPPPVVVETTPTANPATETPAVVKSSPVPVQLPELNLNAQPALVAFVTLEQRPPVASANLLALLDEDVPPAPPAAPKPAISASAAATQASTEPTVTVRYENLPNSSAPAGESGHSITPPASSRPRRVGESKPEEAQPAQTRQRRVKN